MKDKPLFEVHPSEFSLRPEKRKGTGNSYANVVATIALLVALLALGLELDLRHRLSVMGERMQEAARGMMRDLPQRFQPR